jgi:hypothetical protein
MLRNRMPGPYEDRLGPVVLTVLLVLSILVNMSLKLVDIWSPSSSSTKHPIPAPPVSSSHPRPGGAIVAPKPSAPVVHGHGGGGKHKAPPVAINDIGSD